jgi:hypothetical protein
MISPANNRANLATAKRNALASLSLADSSNLTFEERVAYNKALAAEILKYPQSFTPETVASAQIVSGKVYGALESFDLLDAADQFTETALASAKQILPEVGKQILVGLVVVAVFYVVSKNFFNRSPASS